MTERSGPIKQYRCASAWQNGQITYSASVQTLDQAKGILKDTAETFSVSWRGGWVESRTVTEWGKA